MANEIHWNPWHGCNKISTGCLNCYMYEMDAVYGKDSTKISKTSSFKLPIRKDRNGNYKITKDNLNDKFLYTCLTSDFFHEGADEWRQEAWGIIKKRSDLDFFIFTKRIDRFYKELPTYWEDGYDNVYIGVSCENQNYVDARLSKLISLPIKHRCIVLAPLLEVVSIEEYLKDGKVEYVSVGGESCGDKARPLDYNWVLKVREECIRYNVGFTFHQTGSMFIKDGRIYKIPMRKVQASQAQKANIDTV